jgi:hypothetical protein
MNITVVVNATVACIVDVDLAHMEDAVVRVHRHSSSSSTWDSARLISHGGSFHCVRATPPVLSKLKRKHKKYKFVQGICTDA